MTTAATAATTSATTPVTSEPATTLATPATTIGVEPCPGGSGAALPDDAVGVTEAIGDFDGDGEPDRMLVYGEGGLGPWHIRVVLAEHVPEATIPGTSVVARAVGGWDIDRDGSDEVFAVVGSGASTLIVGIFTLSGCDLIPLEIAGSAGGAQFAVGASAANQSGLVCPPAGGVEVIAQSTSDGVEYIQVRDGYALVGGGTLSFLGSSEARLTSPEDDAQIFSAATFDCGALTLL